MPSPGDWMVRAQSSAGYRLMLLTTFLTPAFADFNTYSM
jgi:hypothetical protein